MITAVEIKNFKGVGDPGVRVELRPITLLFGPNSAGKSTLLHALLYAQEVFLRSQLDVDRPAAGGGTVDLGGFKNLVHGRDLGRAVKLKFELDTGADDDWDLDLLTGVGPDYDPVHLSEEHLPALGARPDRAAIEVEVAWSELRGGPYVRRYAVAVNDEPVAAVVAEYDRHEVALTEINPDHPVFRTADGESVLQQVVDDYEGGAVPGPADRFPIRDQSGALPQWRTGLRIDARPDTDWSILSRDSGSGSITLRAIAPGTERFVALFSHLLVSTGMRLCTYLESIAYLGPLRQIPPRAYHPPKYPDPGRWAGGLAAWDALYANEARAVRTGPRAWVEVRPVDEVSDWLGDPDKLDAGYTLRLHEYKEVRLDGRLGAALAAGRVDDLDDPRAAFDALPTRKRLALADAAGLEVQPADIGVGVSQLVPVVVMALAWPGGALVEQPELHLHPAVQAGLGDLLIHAWKVCLTQFVVETHSEHLLLRLFRRVRETAEGRQPAGHPGLTPADLSVVCVEPARYGDGTTQVRQIGVTEGGETADPWPRGFLDERTEELFG